jgi:hypothetical protein
MLVSTEKPAHRRVTCEYGDFSTNETEINFKVFLKKG